jgi:tetratricopeptide (TPR) repeat protein
MSKLTERLLG